MASNSNGGIPNTPYLIDAAASAEVVAEAIERGAVLELER